MTPRLPSGRRVPCLVAVLASALVVSAALAVGPARGPRTVAAEPPKTSAPALPPLEIDTDAPLLDTPAKPASKTDTAAHADNSSCHVCHTNYKKESLATTHAQHAVGCVRCHGPSEAHRNDENNITAPDTMFPLARLDAACKHCHPLHNVPARAVVARFLERKIATTSTEHLVCTECHGEHRLPRRSVVWDRETGKLQTAKPAGTK
jgi:hypothetical protein